jgi:hypothetical protein
MWGADVPAFAQDLSCPDPDVLVPTEVQQEAGVRLYLARLCRTEFHRQIAEHEAGLAQRKFERRLAMADEHLVAPAELERARQESVRARIAELEAAARKRELENMLRVAIAKSLIGSDIPICLVLQ